MLQIRSKVAAGAKYGRNPGRNPTVSHQKIVDQNDMEILAISSGFGQCSFHVNKIWYYYHYYYYNNNNNNIIIIITIIIIIIITMIMIIFIADQTELQGWSIIVKKEKKKKKKLTANFIITAYRPSSYLSGADSFASSTFAGPSISRHSSMIPSLLSPFVRMSTRLGPLVMNSIRSSK